MAETTDRPDDEPEDSRPDESGGVDNTSVVVTGGATANIQIGGYLTTTKREHPPKSKSLAEQRQELYFDLLNKQQTDYFDSWRQDRKHANVAFWAAVVLMLASWLVLLAGGAMSLIQGDLQPLAAASLPGVPFAAVGTGLALYARKAKADTNARADRVEDQITKSHALQTALTLVDEFEDPDKRDNMRVTVVMQTMGLQPNPDTVTDRLISETGVDLKGEIEPGGSKP
ncbi:TRADD-N-associated membrane domain-containing protein [Nocardiopsis aegyptia]|uniref:Cyanobacterial TRADD-N associated 2 transmembrane domain-containing protein n=1 Tax=Nocardiopsis aegyptia TaxID=220378 RepID=A0A7Z0EUL9_9ACTN|nr:hypothetical protein [Nocardiopsis aegyptia]NYJ38121.1 hypothetical protein [Nocardiopsis aegyptia]